MKCCKKGVEPNMNNAVTLLAQDPSVWMAAGLGVTVVFVGLVAIVGLVWVMNKVCDCFLKKKPVAAAPVAVAPTTDTPIENREEIVAAVCAAVAEEEGVDISALRVVSFKKL